MTEAPVGRAVESVDRVGAWAPADRAPVLASHVGGATVIYSAPLPHATTAREHLRNAAKFHSSQGLRPPQLDAALYTGKHRVIASNDGPDNEWVGFQQRLGLPVARTASGYIPGDAPVSTIAAILESARAGRDLYKIAVEAVLPLETEWFTSRRDELVETLGTSDVPLSILGAHATDPFSTDTAVRGLVEVVGVECEVRVDRCDLSGVGALAAGATGTTIGMSSGLRHVYPPSDAGGFGQAAPFSVLVPAFLQWKYIDYVRVAALKDPRVDWWICSCDICCGRPIGDAISSPEQALLHNLYTASILADDVLTSSNPWATLRSRLESAQFNGSEARYILGDVWKPPSHLTAWRNAVPVPVPVAL